MLKTFKIEKCLDDSKIAFGEWFLATGGNAFICASIMDLLCAEESGTLSASTKPMKGYRKVSLTYDCERYVRDVVILKQKIYSAYDLVARELILAGNPAVVYIKYEEDAKGVKPCS